VIPEPTQWNGDDTRDLSSGPPDPRATFRTQFRRFHAKGMGEWFLRPYRGSSYFAAEVQWAEEQMVRELDVIAGEKS
jgi:hypothetical protein